MNRIEEEISKQFYRWEMRGRGNHLFPGPVALEPTFTPFRLMLPRGQPDDGRRHTALSGLFRQLSDSVEPRSAVEPELETEPEPFFREPEELAEVALSIADTRKPHRMESFLRQMARSGSPVAFELLASNTEIVSQFAASRGAASRIEGAVASFLSDVTATTTEDGLAQAWLGQPGATVAVELSLGRECHIPLGNPQCDLLSGVVTTLNGLGKEERVLFQVLFEPVVNAWAENLVASVSDDEMQPLFLNCADLVSAVQRKIATPLFAVVVRLAAKAADWERGWDILADLAAPLSALDRPGSNYLVPASNNDYPDELHEWDVLLRASRRHGMLLSLEELIPLITPPPVSISSKLRRVTRCTRSAPENLTSGSINLGTNVHAGRSKEVYLTREHRVRHAHIIGATGTGKSTLLRHLIAQDIEHGEGLAVFDPHGDLIDSILDLIPHHRVGDVVVVDPSDEEFVIGLNVLTAHSDLERNLIASDLTSVFRRLSTSWGDQMESVLRNAILAFLESPRGGSLSDLRRFLIDPHFRKEFLPTVTDPEVTYYWTHAFPLLGGGKSIGPLLTRLDEFLSRKPIRYMMSAKAIDFAEVIDGGKIFLAKLPQGLVGRQNAHLLGSLLVAKFQQVIMARQRQASGNRRDFWMYLDEFHHFITPSLTEILSGARKYGAGLVLAHQELRQLKLDADVESAVLSNAQTRIAFRTSDADAHVLAEGFASFEAEDIQSLEIGEAICRVERRDHDFNLDVPHASPLQDAAVGRDAIVAASRERYGTPRAEVEAELLRSLKATPLAVSPPPTAVVPEVPQTGSRPPQPSPAAPAAERVAPRPVPEPTSPQPQSVAPPAPKITGKGGQQHKYLQHLIKGWAQDRGWLATVEFAVTGGSVDVCLARGKRKIACEISVTTGSEHEIANVRKCLDAEFDLVALVVEKPRRFATLEKILREEIPGPAVERVRIFTAEGLCAYLDELDAQDSNRTETVRGYAVKVKHRPVDAAAREKRAAALTKVVAESLRQNK